LDVLQWARGNGCPWDKETCSKAARGGHFELLQWAWEQGCPLDADVVCDIANDHLEIVQWAREQGKGSEDI
jgi:hypothetical protein